MSVSAVNRFVSSAHSTNQNFVSALITSLMYVRKALVLILNPAVHLWITVSIVLWSYCKALTVICCKDSYYKIEAVSLSFLYVMVYAIQCHDLVSQTLLTGL